MRKKYPFISIIIPVFNTKPYLDECLQSLLAQTISNIEIICVDNGSTDGSYELLKTYAKKHKNILLMRHTEGRQGGARNAALTTAKGRYIGFVDSDDFVSPEMYATLFSAAQLSMADIVVCNAQQYVQGQGYGITSLPISVLSNKKPFTIEQRPTLLRNATISNRLFKREFIAKYHIRFPEGLTVQDQFFVIKALTLADCIVTVPDTLYYYRKKRPGQTSGNKGADCMHVFEVWRQLSDFVDEAVEDETLKHWINEARIVKYLSIYSRLDGKFQRQYFSQMKSDFRALDIEKKPNLLTPTEQREYQIVICHNFVFYSIFLRLRAIYGKLREYATQFGAALSARRNI